MKYKLFKKRKLIVGLILSLLIICVFIINKAIATNYQIGGKKYNLTKKGNYYENFDTKADILNWTWTELKKYWFGADASKESNTAGTKNATCLNHDANDSTDSNEETYMLRGAGIIDIYGGYIESTGYIGNSNGREYVGKSAAVMAKAAYLKWSGDTDKRYLCENYIYNTGWSDLLSASSSISITNEPTLKHSTSSEVSLMDDAKDYCDVTNSNKYLNISTGGSGVGTNESSSITKTIKDSGYNIGDNTYYTKIGPYSLTHMNGTTKTVTATTENNTYTGIIHKSGDYYYVYFKNKIDGVINSIELTQSYKSYHARIILLATNYSQSRMITWGEEEYTVSIKVNIKIPVKQTDVSLQKYITKVTSTNGNVTYNNSTERKNKYADLNAKFISNPDSYNHQGVDISNKTNEKLNNTDNDYKSSKPISIEAGDTVEYTIKVYNNSNVKAKVTAKDVIDSNATMISNYTNDSGNTYFLCKDMEFNANETKTFTVQLKYDSYTNNKIINKAWISSTNPSNKKTYRTIDADYIQMKKYSVSLEKYVSKVTDKDGNNVVVYDDSEGTYKKRAGHRYNPYASTKVSNDSNVDKITYNTSKKNNPVELEPGDKVTFTIQLKNTGETDVYVKQILDEFINDNGVVLTYVSNSLNANITTGYTESSWGFKFADGKKIDRNLLTFNDKGIYVPANGTNSFTVTFRVDIESDKTNISQTLFNHACINLLKNKNNVTVKDGDAEGVNNNRDTDYLKTKTYAVSLEKYISKVNNVSVHNLKCDVNEDGVVDLNDVELIRKYLAKQPVSLNGKGDINADGTIDSNDVLALRKIIREGKPEYKIDKTNNLSKYKDVVTVQSEDTVTYTIKVKNDSEKTGVYINQITDTLDSKGFDNRTFNILSAKKYNKYGTELSNILSSVRDDTVNASNNVKTITIDCNNNTFLNCGDYISITVSVKVTEPNISLRTLPNTAEITGMQNRNEDTVLDTTPNNNKDSDYIKLDWTPTPVEKTVIKVWDDEENKDGIRPTSIRVQLYKNGVAYGEPVTLSDSNGWTYTWKNLVKEENGNEIKYTVKELSVPDKYTVTYSTDTFIITNTHKPENPPTPPDDDTTTKTVIKVWDDANNKYGKRPSDIKVQLYKTVENSTTKDGGEETLNSSNGWTHTWTDLKEKDDKGNAIVYSVREVSVPNGYTVSYSSDTFTITNRYIDEDKPKDAVISGIVWNDISTNKTSDNYDGLYQKSNEQLLSGIKVLLYRLGVSDPISKTTTDSNGYYYFNNDSIDATVIENSWERYIKGPLVSADDNNWAGTYYSYYVVFEYDGITYTSTFDGNGTRIWSIKNNDGDKQYSNAKEDGTKVKESRSDFNKKFSTIKSDGSYNEKDERTGDINYTTKNDEGYIPQSNHIYNPSTMAIQSSTNLINLNDFKESEEKLEHVNLGLRGRDVLDLELTSDVVSTKVTVNGVDGTYNYGNKVTVRRNDLSSMYNVKEDMANVYGTGSQYIGEDYKQKVRKTDIKNDAYKDTGLEIYVTYRITVKNASQTQGAVTEIIDYYDSRYTFEGISGSDSGEVMSANDKTPGQVIITKTNKIKYLNQSDSIYVDLTFKLKDESVKELFDWESGKATYNMAEISEYKTKCGSSQTEYTRGLIDKDSAPGSVATEKVRLASGNSTDTTDTTDTTLGYYFKAQNLQNLKYEDDTYAAPTLYFVSDDSKRTITGTVFEDYTQINSDKVKSGNGVKDDNELGIYGATVELIEGNTTRYTVTTDVNGEYTFSGFLPGNYIIRYHYGDTEKTVVTDPNKKSYNGEDFQSTNNSYSFIVNGKDIANKLSTRDKYWYLDNDSKGISTATDDSDRRIDVSKTVTDFTDDKMTVLNNLRAKKNKDESKVGDITVDNIIEDTKMNANTANMLFEVEKPEIKDNKVVPTTEFKDYVINGMNFGIAEVPVTTIDLQKHVQSFTIKDSTGQNVIAKVEKINGEWKFITGITNESTNGVTTQIEDEKLQGAKLEVTYNITSNITVQKNFDGKDIVKATITGLVDYIDNDLSYNENLGANKDNWVVTNYTDVLSSYKEASFKDSNGNKKIRTGTVDSDGTKYTTIVKLKDELISKLNNGESIPITLEKVLSSTDSTIDEIITSTVDTYEYNNVVEITGIKYDNTKTDETGDDFVFRDRVRTPETSDPSNSRMIILAGGQYDSATSETISIIPPTGDNNINIIYYIIAAVSLVVIAAGTFGIKKFVLKK